VEEWKCSDPIKPKGAGVVEREDEKEAVVTRGWQGKNFPASLSYKGWGQRLGNETAPGR